MDFMVRETDYLPLYFATRLRVFYSATEMKREENNLCSAEQQDSISFLKCPIYETTASTQIVLFCCCFPIDLTAFVT